MREKATLVSTTDPGVRLEDVSDRGTHRIRFDSYAARKLALGELSQVRDAVGEDPEAVEEHRSWDDWEEWAKTTPPPMPPRQRGS